MDTSWMSEPRSSTPFLKGLGEFLDVECNQNANGVGEIKCPCAKCDNNLWETRDNVTEHIICNGIMEDYNTQHLEVHQVVKEVAQVGIWGTKSKGFPRNHWSFRLENNHKLKKITIDHGDLIFSLKFTSEDKGSFHDSETFGGWNGGNEETEVTFEFDEEIIGINGTVSVSTGEYAGYTIISSLSFITNKTTHGPFGQTTGTPFEVPWNKGSFGGFYGLAGFYIDGMGVYLKTSQETARVGLWGTEFSTGQQYRWSFCLEESYKLTKITIDHGDMISSLTFTSEDCTVTTHVSNKAGGYNDGTAISEVNLAWDEEIIGINGTFGVSTNSCGGKTISSLCFITNKRSHGPFGRVTSTSFSVPWSKGSFAGFYGTASYYINSIGVYLRASA